MFSNLLDHYLFRMHNTRRIHFVKLALDGEILLQPKLLTTSLINSPFSSMILGQRFSAVQLEINESQFLFMKLQRASGDLRLR